MSKYSVNGPVSTSDEEDSALDRLEAIDARLADIEEMLDSGPDE